MIGHEPVSTVRYDKEILDELRNNARLLKEILRELKKREMTSGPSVLYANILWLSYAQVITFVKIVASR
jgi:hypothetical protein